MTLREHVDARVAQLRDPASCPPVEKFWAEDRRCDSCKLGDHKCTCVECYGCTDEIHRHGPKGIGARGGSSTAPPKNSFGYTLGDLFGKQG